MSSHHATILVCDDDRLVLITLASALKNAGYDVIEADNGDDAILLARQHRPDLALLDIRMDGKSGLDVASYLRDYVGTPFMFLSAFSDDAFIAKAREFGALDYLVKPIDIELIAPAVAQAMRAARERESRSPMVPGQPAPVSHEDSEAVRLVAVGILMERFRLTREMAEQRLMALARQASRQESQYAQELVRSIDSINAVASSPAIR
ncbi:MAG: response regulator [Burkholderiaceae bacterium]|nr:response regulator [Burkholderiaceae bacterium]MBP6814215.1 response regulator [Burkholderiaceae bacterium]MBP7658966.1 response regulator [Burkholderiaceae bacterium]